MKATVKTKIGQVEYVFEVEEQEEMKTLHKVAVLANPPSVCDECGNGSKSEGKFKLDSNKDKEANIYVNVVCEDCEAKAKLGLYKSGGYFWHKFEKWQRKSE